jgi:DNA-binding transcriptional MerR regulator
LRDVTFGRKTAGGQVVSLAARTALEPLQSKSPYSGSTCESLGVTLRISSVAADNGVSLRTLRHYEAEGLLISVRRRGVRYFTAREADRAARIVLLRRADVPLAQVREILEAENDQTCVTEIRRVLEAQVASLGAQLRTLHEILAGFRDGSEGSNLGPAPTRRSSACP